MIASRDGWLIAAALGIVIAIGCDRGETDVHAGARTGHEIPVVEAPREDRQLAPPGDVVAQLRRSAEPEVTVYEPPPDLGRPDLGVVYLPSGPSAAPASGFGDTLGMGRPTTSPVPGGPAPGTRGQPAVPPPTARDTTGS